MSDLRRRHSLMIMCARAVDAQAKLADALYQFQDEKAKQHAAEAVRELSELHKALYVKEAA